MEMFLIYLRRLDERKTILIGGGREAEGGKTASGPTGKVCYGFSGYVFRVPTSPATRNPKLVTKETLFKYQL